MKRLWVNKLYGRKQKRIEVFPSAFSAGLSLVICDRGSFIHLHNEDADVYTCALQEISLVTQIGCEQYAVGRIRLRCPYFL